MTLKAYIISDETIGRLKKYARKRTLAERGVPTDDGGNFDDTYNEGVEDGKTELAREILAEAGISWLE